LVFIARVYWCLLLLLPAYGLADEFQVRHLSAQLKGNTYVMDARINYRFSDRALEALENGVPLTLEVHVQLRGEGAWIWEEDLLDIRLRYQIRYQALAAVYQVVDLQSNSKQTFVTRESAIDALGRIPDFPLVSRDRLQAGENYMLSLYSKLDIEALPLPLRPLAYITPSWNLSSDWTTWRLEH
jgi:hypothetical protein